MEYRVLEVKTYGTELNCRKLFILFFKPSRHLSGFCQSLCNCFKDLSRKSPEDSLEEKAKNLIAIAPSRPPDCYGHQVSSIG